MKLAADGRGTFFYVFEASQNRNRATHLNMDYLRVGQAGMTRWKGRLGLPGAIPPLSGPGVASIWFQTSLT